jgi:hypothetical protein
MGYKHYWYRPNIIPDAVFYAIQRDFAKLIFCRLFLGYGDWFGIIEQRIDENWKSVEGSTESRGEIEPSKLSVYEETS